MRHPFIVVLLVTGSAAATPKQPADPPKVQRICREAEQELGTHVHTSSRCLTADEWQREDQAKSQTPLSLRVTVGQDAGKPPK